MNDNEMNDNEMRKCLGRVTGVMTEDRFEFTPIPYDSTVSLKIPRRIVVANTAIITKMLCDLFGKEVILLGLNNEIVMSVGMITYKR